MYEREKLTDKPVMIILQPVKGKGVSFAEGKVSSHSMTYGVAEAEAEVARIRKEDE